MLARFRKKKNTCGRKRLKDYSSHHLGFRDISMEEPDVMRDVIQRYCRSRPRRRTRRRPVSSYSHALTRPRAHIKLQTPDCRSTACKLLGKGRRDLAAALFRDVSRLKHCETEDSIDIPGLGAALQEGLDAATRRSGGRKVRHSRVAQDANRRQTELQMEPYRPRRKRLALDPLYGSHGVPIDDVHKIGEAISEEWAPVLTRKEVGHGGQVVVLWISGGWSR